LMVIYGGSVALGHGLSSGTKWREHSRKIKIHTASRLR
jgi:hypothetical protein